MLLLTILYALDQTLYATCFCRMEYVCEKEDSMLITPFGPY
jgi:hypothetical protein